jgi:hypothetical protein
MTLQEIKEMERESEKGEGRRERTKRAYGNGKRTFLERRVKK